MVFKYTDLADDTFYYKLFENLFMALYQYTKDKPEYADLHRKIELGTDDFYYISKNIENVNRCFVKLLEINELETALSLVRLQTDNLKYVYAETKYLTCVLHKVFENGLELNQIKIKGKAINPTELIAELDNKYGDVRRIWRYYSGYVHPSSKIKNNSMPSYYSYKLDKRVISIKYLKEAAKDMIYINQVIANVLSEYIQKIQPTTK